MSKFNPNFFRPNTEATVEQATQRLIDLGYSNFHYKSMSRSNVASFYFTSENGEEIRVSDHRLTGNRAFNTIQVDLYEVKTSDSSIRRKRETPKFELTAEMIEKARLRKEAMRNLMY